MRDFVVSKVIASSIPLLLVAFSLTFVADNPHAAWGMLILATVFFGHIHNAISFKYQIRAICRRKNVKEIIIFMSLLAASAVLVLTAIAHGKEAWLVPFVFIVFYLHSYLNEQTILGFQTGIHLPISFFLFLTFLPMSLMYISLLHPSFFYNSQITFYTLSLAERVAYVYGQLPVSPYIIAAFCLGVAAVFLVAAARQLKAYPVLLAISILLLVASVGAVLFLPPLSYVYIFSISFIYHYVLWSVVYYQKFRNERSSRMSGYIKEHLLLIILLVILVIAFYALEGTTLHTLATWVFDLRVFFVTAFAHTVVSFINEPWFRRLLY